MIKYLEKEEDFNNLIQNRVLVDFYADWCGPCKMLAPILETLASKHPDVKVLKVNVDAEQNLAMKHSIMAIPTLIVYKDGKQSDVRQGFANLELLEEMIGE